MQGWERGHQTNAGRSVSPQGGIGEKGAEGTAGNDGARVSESLVPPPPALESTLSSSCEFAWTFQNKVGGAPTWSGLENEESEVGC